MAAFVNSLACLGWLRGGGLFDGKRDDPVLTLPQDGPSRGLPPGTGAIERALLPETKSDPALLADVVVALTTASGLGPCKWALRLQSFEFAIPGKLFSAQPGPVWTSHHFRHHFSIPLLEQMWLKGEPTL